MVALDDGSTLASVEFDSSGTTGPSAMEYGIASAPAVLDLDGDGFADGVYIGDLGGQLWKSELSEVGENTTGDARLDNYPVGRIFTAPITDMGGGAKHYKSIFMPPSAAFLSGDLVLAFASGERTDLRYAGDTTKDDNNRFWLLEDPHPTGGSAFSTTFTESDLTNITGQDKDLDYTDQGFFVVAPENEKFVTAHTIFGGVVITTSYIPDLTGGSPCDVQGASVLHLFDLATGLGSFYDVGVTEGDAARRLSIGSGLASDPRITLDGGEADLYVQTSDGRLVTPPSPPPNSSGLELIYWRQNF